MEELIPILDAYIAQCKTSTRRIPTRLLSIGDVVVITVGGALFTQFSIQIKAAFKAYPVFIWGLTDASVGYLVAEEEYGENSEAWLTRFPKGIAEQYIQHVIDECSDFIALHFKTS